MNKVTAVEFQNNFGEYSDKAEKNPLIITKYGKPRLLVISIEDVMQLLQNNQKSLHISELSENQISSILNAEAPKENEYLNELMKGD